MKAWLLMLVGGFIFSGCAMVDLQCKKSYGLKEGNKCRRKHASINIIAPIDLNVNRQIYRRGHGYKYKRLTWK